ncbi:MAG: hypothetical protein HY305_03675, partial [Sphingobacteriales bacterium]|nr:hypothetical protein [Sphingobacteriales bacterium]
MNDESDLTRPSYQFILKDVNAFAAAPLFITASFITKDTASLHHTALLILQDLLQFHLKDANPEALIDADIIRLNFVNQYAINENKIKLYEEALKNIEKKYSDNSAVAQAGYLRANIYYTKGQDFDPLTKTDNQYEIKRAKELGEAIVKKFPKSEGGVNAQNLISQIKQPSLTMETEQVNIPGQPFRSLVNYKNTRTIYLRVIRTSTEEIKRIARKETTAGWKEFTKLNAIKNWQLTLPDPQDYQQHATEIKVDGLPVGTYLILASIDSNFSLQNNIISRQTTYVSNISNEQKVNSIELTTNEYGSYSGTFKLPEALLNGQFSLFDQNTNSYEYFNIEEYKRPKFFVEVQKPKGTYRLNDSVKVTVAAKAYAGNNIDGAAIKYRVVRKVVYPIWWQGGYIRKGRYANRHNPIGRNNEMEITNGEAITNAAGEFSVVFKALPDESVDKKTQPTFNYEVTADVTDINGETRSGNTSVA